jgi:hypothetical protein
MGQIVVTSDENWYGAASTGLSTVIVDGRKVGSLSPRGAVKISVLDGDHTVQIKRFWLSSPKVTVNVSLTNRATLLANRTEERFFRWSFKALFWPSECLNLRVTESLFEEAVTEVSTHRIQNLMLLMNVLLVGGLVVALAGLRAKSNVTEVIGLAVAVTSYVVFEYMKSSMRKQVNNARNKATES